jgi:O-antigen ligase
MIELLGLGVALLIAGAFGVALLEVLVSRADIGAGFVLVGMLLQAVFVERVPSLYLKDTRIELSDLLFVLVVAAGLARLLRVRRYTPLLRWLLLLGIVLLVSLLRGMLTISPQGSINDFRQYLQFAGPALYFATFPPSAWLSDRIGRIWLAAAGVMVALVTLRWLDVFAGVHLGVPAEEFGNDTAIRVIDGPYTFFLATAAVLTLPAWVQHGRRARRLRWLSVLLLLFVMLLDRRTVWLAMLVGVVVLLLRNRRFGRRALAMLAGAAIVTSLVFVAFPGSSSDQEPLARSATSTGTLTWRVDGWSELLSSWSENPANWLVGRPFGSGFERRVEGSQVDSHPHNFYIETMLRSGVAGLLALIALTAGLLRALWRLGRGSGARGLFGPDVLPALVAMQLVWFITWVPGSEQGIVTGLALALVATRARAPRRDPGRARQRDDQATVAAPAVAPAAPGVAPAARASAARGPLAPGGGERP